MERRPLREPSNDSPPLQQRIAEALDNAAIKSAALAALYNEVAAAVAQAETAAADSRQRALDPTIADPAAARVERDDALYKLERLKAALPPLQQRYTEVRLAERRAQWRTDYAAVKAKRDATADKLQASYELALQLIDVLIEAKQVDQDIARINSTAPNGEHDRLLSVECAARQVTGVAEQFSLMNIKLPAFDAPGQWLWPPPVPPILPEQVIPAAMLQHPGANWAEELKQRDARRQQEAERVADYHRRRAREKEDMENAAAKAAAQARRQAAT